MAKKQAKEGKKQLRHLIGRLIKAKEDDLFMFKKIAGEIDSRWTNEKFAELLTYTHSWKYIQSHPSDFITMDRSQK